MSGMIKHEDLNDKLPKLQYLFGILKRN